MRIAALVAGAMLAGLGEASAYAPADAPTQEEIKDGCAEYGRRAYEVAKERDAGVTEREAMRLAMQTDDPLWSDRMLAIVETVYVNVTVRPHDLALAVQLVCLEEGGW